MPPSPGFAVERPARGGGERREQPPAWAAVSLPVVEPSGVFGAGSKRPGLACQPAGSRNATLRSQLSVLSPAERLQRIRKRPRRSKEGMLHEVMQHSSNENQKVQEWRDSERRVCQQNEERRHKSAVLRQQSTDRPISVMERQVDLIQALVAMQVELYNPPSPPQPLSQNYFSCAPMSPPTHFPQHPGSYHHQLPPTPVASPPSPENYNPYVKVPPPL
ncbi:uncharacterized protein [Lepidochelys kempii]|uniref:uncharacterized protein n=1 Tax=Lepidochelys kempii TaxID=8472 RepID=UPI003C6FF997